jgi:hypothetical protein
VRHRHQEVPLDLLGLGETPRHLPEALGQVRDLRPARHGGNLDGVPPQRDLVRDLGQLDERPRQPPRQIDGESRGDEQTAEEGEREAVMALTTDAPVREQTVAKILELDGFSVGRSVDL